MNDLLRYERMLPYFYDVTDEYVTPIAIATFYGLFKCLELLREHGAAGRCHAA